MGGSRPAAHAATLAQRTGGGKDTPKVLRSGIDGPGAAALAGILSRAVYLTSAVRCRDLPADRGREVAFLGRSNAGKSSLLNAISGSRGLARTSKIPGRTQALVVFAIDPERRLVDLPGYGFARAPRAVLERWHTLVPQYLSGRRSLAATVLVMDARHPLRDSDREVLALLGDLDRPLVIALTKADKLGRQATLRAVAEVRAAVQARVLVQACSARTGAGVDALRALLAGWLDLAPAAGAAAMGRAGDP